MGNQQSNLRIISPYRVPGRLLGLEDTVLAPSFHPWYRSYSGELKPDEPDCGGCGLSLPRSKAVYKENVLTYTCGTCNKENHFWSWGITKKAIHFNKWYRRLFRWLFKRWL